VISRKYRKHTEAEIEILKRPGSLDRFSLGDFLGIAALTALWFCGGGWLLGKALDYLLARPFPYAFKSAVLAPVLLLVGSICTVVSVVRGERVRRARLRHFEDRRMASVADGRVELIECDATEAAELD